MGVWRPIQNTSVAVPLAVAVEEAADPAHGILQVIGVGQEDNAQMVRMGPVEAAALDHQHLFLQQEFEDEVLVVEDRIGLGVDVYKRQVVEWMCRNKLCDWTLVAREDIDTKVGNGFTLAFMVRHQDRVGFRDGEALS